MVNRNQSESPELSSESSSKTNPLPATGPRSKARPGATLFAPAQFGATFLPEEATALTNPDQPVAESNAAYVEAYQLGMDVPKSGR